MTTTVAAVQAELDSEAAAQAVTGYPLPALPADPVTGVKAMAPIARLAWLDKAMTELGLPTDCLAPARVLVDRERDLQRRTTERVHQATLSRAKAMQRLVSDPKAPLDDAAAAWLASSPWLDAPAGSRPPGVQMTFDARRGIEGQVDGTVQGAGETIFTLAQGKAVELVAEAAALPPLPKDIWLSPTPAEDLPRLDREHRATWGTLIAVTQDFEAAHRVAGVVRDIIGAGPDRLPDGAPRHALTFRNWRPLLDDQRFGLLKPALRIRYALDHGWEPGLWRPEDVKTKPEDRTFWGKMRNLGSAVGVVGAP